MKSNFEILKANIENLKSLWTEAGLPFQGTASHTEFKTCIIKNSEWPNRLWFNEEVSPLSLSLASQHIRSLGVNLTIPLWIHNGNNSHDLMLEQGYNMCYDAVAMSMKLGQPYNEPHNIVIKKVSGQNDARIWVELFFKSFGFRFGSEIIMQTGNKISYFLAYFQDKPIGTALLYQKDKIAGIYSVSIISEMRRRGFAEQLMNFLLNLAIENGDEYSTLQSSEIGKPLYRKLGYIEQSIIKNYRLIK